jgi:hypothetical protein
MQVWPVADLLSLLPQPFVSGVDFQKMQGEIRSTLFLDRDLAHGHPAYYVTALAVKLPLAMLALLLAGAVLRRPRWPARLPVLVAAAVLVPLAVLSLLSGLQIGVRYVAQLVPPLCLIAARAVPRLAAAGWPGRAALAAAAASLLWFHAAAWPRYTSAFNALAGDRPYLLFTDSTIAWPGSFYAGDDRALLERHPGAALVGEHDGPRLGLCLANAFTFSRRDERRPGYLYHWLRRHHPIDRLGPWFVFDASEPSFRRAVEAAAPAERGRALTELATALVFAGRIERGLEALRGVDDPDADAVRTAAVCARQTRPPPQLYVLASRLQRHDVVLAAGEAAGVYFRALALHATGQREALLELLTRTESLRRLEPREAMLLATAYHVQRREGEALSVLERYLPEPGTAERDRIDELRGALQRRLDYERRLERLGIPAGLDPKPAWGATSGGEAPQAPARAAPPPKQPPAR